MSKDKKIVFQEITEELYDLYCRKNQDYGDSFGLSYEKYGLTMSAIRLGDKFNRFENLLNSPISLVDESVEDTLTDLANYAIMTLIEIRIREKAGE